MMVEITPDTRTFLVPAWITDEKYIEQYCLGIAWHQYRQKKRKQKPLTERYLLRNLKWMSKKGPFNGSDDDWALENLSFFLGMLSQE